MISSRHSIYRLLFALLALILVADLAAPLLPAQIVDQRSIQVTRQRRSEGDDEEDRDSGISDDGVLHTPHLRDIPRPAQGSASPNTPLYLVHPPEQVIVGQVGPHQLTRLELERMVAARMLVEGTMQTAPPDPNDDIAVREWEVLQARFEDELLHEWAILKSLVVAAQKAGLRVTQQEVELNLASLTEQTLGNQSPEEIRQYNRAIGLDPDALRTQVSEALLIDKFILQEIEKNFTEDNLREIYERNPIEYVTHRKVRAWRITRTIDPAIRRGSREYSDIREQFYDIARRAARRQGRDFQDLARRHSDDPITRESGGDMGWVDFSIPLPEEIQTVLASLRPGQVSGIVETRTGLHIYMVTEVQEAQGLTFDASARQRVIDRLIFAFKEERGEAVMRSLDVPVRLNPSGLNLRNPEAAVSRPPIAPQPQIRRPDPEPAVAPPAAGTPPLSPAPTATPTPAATPAPILITPDGIVR